MKSINIERFISKNFFPMNLQAANSRMESGKFCFRFLTYKLLNHLDNTSKYHGYHGKYQLHGENTFDADQLDTEITHCSLMISWKSTQTVFLKPFSSLNT